MTKKIGSMEAGQGISIGHTTKEQSSIKELFLAVREELNDMKTKLDIILAKMDTDFTAQNAAVAGSQLDVDYASTGAFEADKFE